MSLTIGTMAYNDVPIFRTLVDGILERAGVARDDCLQVVVYDDGSADILVSLRDRDGRYVLDGKDLATKTVEVAP